jgi:hypothetical protein
MRVPDAKAAHSKRPSLSSTEASDGRLARFGRIDRRANRVLDASVCRTDARKVP